MNIKLKYLFIFVAIAAMVSSCTKGFEDLNANPNQPSSVSTSFLLTSAQKQLMDYTIDEWWNGRRGQQLSQFWSSNQYSSESRYQLRPGITNSYWISFYAGGMADLEEIIRLNTESPEEYVGYGSNDNQIAVATIMQAWVFQMLSDCFGDIPFSEALQGADFPNPKYDSQADVYSGIIAMLNNASSMINVGESGPQGDVVYNGDMAQWQKFANSLKLRVALRMADANAGAAETAVGEAVDAGVFGSNSDNAHFQYQSGAPNNNPINEDAKTRNDFCASNVIIDYMTGLSDPRMGHFFNANTDGEYVGEVYGLTEEDAALTPDASISQRSDKVLAAEFPGTYMDYAETEFFMAEACERGWATGSAEDHYNAGIQASMAWWGVAQEDIDSYMAQEAVAYSTAAGSWKEKIGAQKWLALYMQGIEGWTEYRRLDFGILQLPAGGVLAGDGNVPLRMTYPTDEQTLNGTSYAAAVAAQGADALETALWWDVN